MREKAVHEIESSSRALQVFVCITLLLTVINAVISFKYMMEDINIGNFSAESIERVFFCLFYIVIQLFAIMTFRSIAKNKTPFLAEVARNIKIIGGLIMFSNALPRWISGIISLILNDGGVFTIVDGTVMFGLVLGLIFFCLGSIFDYGCALQQQDDEML